MLTDPARDLSITAVHHLAMFTSNTDICNGYMSIYPHSIHWDYTSDIWLLQNLNLITSSLSIWASFSLYCRNCETRCNLILWWLSRFIWLLPCLNWRSKARNFIIFNITTKNEKKCQKNFPSYFIITVLFYLPKFLKNCSTLCSTYPIL